jgi:hypothetical protein
MARGSGFSASSTADTLPRRPLPLASPRVWLRAVVDHDGCSSFSPRTARPGTSTGRS